MASMKTSSLPVPSASLLPLHIFVLRLSLVVPTFVWYVSLGVK